MGSGDFIEPLFVNWESEFLQQFAYVVLTIFLFQKGASESKKFGEPDPSDEKPEQHQDDPNAPWPVRKGGLALIPAALRCLYVVSRIDSASAF